MKMNVLAILSCAMVIASTSAYTEKDRSEAYKFVEDSGMPLLGAFKRMTPKMLKTVLSLFLKAKSDDSFEYLNQDDLEILFLAVSAANNCELCLSFHSMALKEKLSENDLNAMLAGGLPSPTEKRVYALAVAAKYALAHKGALLRREKEHLATLGFDSEEKLLEVIYACGFMGANNMAYIHMIGNGMEVESFLRAAGPFQNSVYAKTKSEEL